jgi:hypothetical protein
LSRVSAACSGREPFIDDLDVQSSAGTGWYQGTSARVP